MISFAIIVLTGCISRLRPMRCCWWQASRLVALTRRGIDSVRWYYARDIVQHDSRRRRTVRGGY